MGEGVEIPKNLSTWFMDGPLWKIGLFWQRRFMTRSARMSQATLRDMIKYLNSELLNLLLNYKLDIYILT